MLNGVAPILIFTFPVLPAGTFSLLSGIPLVGESLAASVALPIPIYLSEQLTGIYIDSETKSIDLQTEVDGDSQGIKTDVAQAALASTVTINMKALRSSTALAALIGLLDVVFAKALSKGYTVSYLNGPTTVFNAKIDAFNVSTDSDNELMIMSLVLNQSNKVTQAVKAINTVQKAFTGVA